MAATPSASAGDDHEPVRSALQIAAMQRRHLPSVMAIDQQVYDRPWSAGLFEAELDRHKRCYLTAWAGPPSRGDLRGYGGIMVAIDEAHVTTLAVAPAHQGRKVGSRLLVALLRAAREMGATAATLEVRASNDAAQQLYRRVGFAPVGIRPGYYAATREDAIIMWAYDVDGPAFAARLDALDAAARRTRQEVAPCS